MIQEKELLGILIFSENKKIFSLFLCYNDILNLQIERSDFMKLVTFQSMQALEYLVKNKELICNEKYINKDKLGSTYEWVLEKMNKQIKNNSNIKYPIWCWVKCYNGICPSKRKGKKIENYDVKITFNKKDNEVFITDFIRYSFILNNMYIPDNKEDYLKFKSELEKYNITEDELKAYVRKDKYKFHRTDKEYLNICKKIKKSFDKTITTNSDILQGCVWNIKLEEIEKIEILKEDGYSYGSINYVRNNGKRMDWIQLYLRNIK